MAGPVRYLSGRQDTLRLGIQGHSEELTSLQVLSRVGIGTTNATADLYVKGGAEVTGIITATTFSGTLVGNVTGNLTGTATTATTADNVIGGIAQITNLNVSGGLSTVSSGLTATGGVFVDNLTVLGIGTFEGDANFKSSAKLGDNNKILMGAAEAFEIYNNGAESIIKEDGGGDLKILGNDVLIKNTADDSTAAQFINGAQAELFYNNSKKFETAGAGVTVTGITSTTNLFVTSTSTFKDNLNVDDNEVRFDFGTADQTGSIIRTNIVERDIDILRINGFADDITANSGDYGFNIKYQGSHGGNNKSLSVFSDNQTGTQVEALSILQDGKVGIGTSLARAELDVYGECRVTDLTVLEGATFAGVNISDALGGSLVVSGITTLGDHVSVGQTIYHTGDLDTYIHFTEDRIRLFAGGEQLIDAFEGAQDYVKLGDGGDVDINLNDVLHVNGNTGRVGINSTIPSRDLDIDGGVRLQGAYTIRIIRQEQTVRFLFLLELVLIGRLVLQLTLLLVLLLRMRELKKELLVP